MSVTQSNKLYCSECGELTTVVKHRDAIYPDHPYTTYYSSKCCEAEIVDQFGKPYLYGELQQIHTDQLSDEVEDD